jgi:hypothetical protein
MFKFFKDFNTLNPDFGPVVIFLDCSFHRGHRAYSKCHGRKNADQSRKVRIQVLDSFPVIWHLLYELKHKKSGAYRNGTECGPGFRCRVRGSMPYRFGIFLRYQSEGGHADPDFWA